MVQRSPQVPQQCEGFELFQVLGYNNSRIDPLKRIHRFRTAENMRRTSALVKQTILPSLHALGIESYGILYALK